MIVGPRRIALIGVIVAVALAIIFYPLIVLTPIDTSKVSIILSKMVLDEGGSDEQELLLRPTFTVTNNNNFTLTTSRIDYEVFADGESVVTETLSYEDVPVNGRPALFSGTQVPLTHFFTVKYSDERADLFARIQNNSTQISWSVNGTATIESGTTLISMEFESNLQS